MRIYLYVCTHVYACMLHAYMFRYVCMCMHTHMDTKEARPDCQRQRDREKHRDTDPPPPTHTHTLIVNAKEASAYSHKAHCLAWKKKQFSNVSALVYLLYKVLYRELLRIEMGVLQNSCVLTGFPLIHNRSSQGCVFFYLFSFFCALDGDMFVAHSLFLCFSRKNKLVFVTKNRTHADLFCALTTTWRTHKKKGIKMKNKWKHRAKTCGWRPRRDTSLLLSRCNSLRLGWVKKWSSVCKKLFCRNSVLRPVFKK
jgi:hypothetical protein